MKRRNIFGLMMAAVLALAFTGCKSPDDKEGFPELVLTQENSLVIEKYMEHDATAAYPLTLHVRMVGSNIKVEGGAEHPTDAAAQAGLASQNTYLTGVALADLGEVHNLRSIEEIPATGWDKDLQSLQEGHGYMVKAWGASNVNQYDNAAIHDPAPLYVRIYVQEPVDGGYLIRYQYPFIPEE